MTSENPSGIFIMNSNIDNVRIVGDRYTTISQNKGCDARSVVMILIHKIYKFSEINIPASRWIYTNQAL
jgi:hypothetical protein